MSDRNVQTGPQPILRSSFIPASAASVNVGTWVIPERPRVNTLAWVTLALSVLYLAGIASVAGVFVGLVSLHQIRARGERGRGLAVAGLTVGFILATLTTVTLTVLLIAHGASSGK